ncbi:CU044_5270 family protein [Saccharothrix luteola]|uniref:CU044_5270 family protein n=1 Tax=Saccharothrix luteola TaxID=2893018 RepID=UPI001E4D4229|nr:CU044_5270 family protein [Saccharothrix luteola]MCC8244125.1 CU044_5270 family protein [Saccharothrix luteola]
MDDLKVLRELGDETPLPDEAALAPARAALLAGIAERGPVRLRKRRSRYALVGASAIGLAAAVAATITLLPAGQPAPGGEAVATSTSAVVEPVTDPVRLLAFAARAARAEPAVTPRPDQFVYTRSDTGTNGGAPREIWLSVDGTRDGVLHDHGERIPLPGCQDGRAVVIKGTEVLPGMTEPCEPLPAYRADLPTDVDGMLAYLDANASGEPGSVNARGKDVLALINESRMLPAARAALYEAAARVPGLAVVPDARDAAGRPGVGITWPVPSGSSPEAEPVVIVFDTETYELLGTNFHAITAQAVVDQAGQRP